jgi:hypothetical protein
MPCCSSCGFVVEERMESTQWTPTGAVECAIASDPWVVCDKSPRGRIQLAVVTLGLPDAMAESALAMYDSASAKSKHKKNSEEDRLADLAVCVHAAVLEQGSPKTASDIATAFGIGVPEMIASGIVHTDRLAASEVIREAVELGKKKGIAEKSLNHAAVRQFAHDAVSALGGKDVGGSTKSVQAYLALLALNRAHPKAGFSVGPKKKKIDDRLRAAGVLSK